MTIRKAMLAAALFFAATWGQCCYADEGTSESLTVLGVTLRLGATKTTTFPQFASYKIACLGDSSLAPDCDSWFVQSIGPPYTPYANLFFENGKLKQVLKYWDRGYQGTDPSQFVDTLHAALSNYAGGSSSEVRVQTKETKDGAVVQKTIFISKGKRTISINSVTGMRDSDGKETPQFVNLSEILQ